MPSPSQERLLPLEIFGKRFIQRASANRGKRLERDSDGLKQQRSKQDNLKKTEHRHSKTQNNISRVTVKRGIFPNMICSKLIKRQLFNQHNDKSTASSTSNGSSLLNQINRVKKLRTTEDGSTPLSRPNPTKKMKPDDDVLLSDSPFLLHLKRPGFDRAATDDDEPSLEGLRLFADETVEYTAMEKPRNGDLPPSFWPLSNAGNDRTKADHPDSFRKSQKPERYSSKREYEELKSKVAQVESSTSSEAELMYWYQQFTDSIKRVMIVEREKNFEEFPDALETIKDRLRRLRLQRLEETSHDIAESSSKDLLKFTSVHDEKDAGIPMNVDESIRSPLFFTPVPLNAKNRSRPVSKPSSVKSVSDDEDAMPSAFNFNPEARRPYEFERKNDDNDFENAFLPPAVVRKGFQRPAVQKNHADDSHSFPGPSCSGVGDTIGQNAGLAGVEYLKNIKPKNKVPENDVRDVTNKYRRNWWDVSPPYKSRGGNQRHIDDDLRQWRNPSPPPAVNATDKLQFDLRRKAAPWKDDKDFLPPKRSSNLRTAADRDEEFHFDRVMHFRGEADKKRSRYRIDDYNVEDDSLLMFDS